MAAGLSSNWKKLQAQIKAEPSVPKRESAAGKSQNGKNGRNGRNGRTGTEGATKKKRPLEGDGAVAKRQRRSDPRPTRKGMGVTQSSQLSREAAYPNNGKGFRLGKGTTPSAGLWADTDALADDVAEAYGLAGVPRGVGVSGSANTADATPVTPVTDVTDATDRENAGLTPNLPVGKYVSLDCEMVGAGDGGHEDVLARVSVVDFFGRQVYDSYVKPQAGQRVTDWRTHVSGVTPRHMRFARPYDEVRGVVARLLAGDADSKHAPRILVGHDVRHDLSVLGLTQPPRLVRDTAKFGGFRQYGHGPKPALRVLARELLGVTIQDGAHSSVVDARVTMQLFRQHKPAFDVECANKYGPDARRR